VVTATVNAIACDATIATCAVTLEVFGALAMTTAACRADTNSAVITTEARVTLAFTTSKAFAVIVAFLRASCDGAIVTCPAVSAKASAVGTVAMGTAVIRALPLGACFTLPTGLACALEVCTHGSMATVAFRAIVP